MVDRVDVNVSELAKHVRRLIYNAYTATLVGNPAKVTENYFQRAREPVVGDLVAEVSTVYRSRGTTDLDAVGYLEKITQEPVDFGDPDFAWDEKEEGRPHPKERCFYIRTLDGREFRWTNASFIAAVTDLRST